MMRFAACLLLAGSVWAVSPHPQAMADEASEWAVQPCEQSIIAAPPGVRGDLVCRVRSVTTEGRRQVCHLTNYSRSAASGAAAGPAFHFFAVGGVDLSSGCYALWFAPDQVASRLRKFDSLTGGATDWGEPVKLSEDTTAVQFAAGGRRCVGFQKMGEKLGAGGITRTEGYYCEPPGASAPLSSEAMQRDISYARLKGR